MDVPLSVGERLTMLRNREKVSKAQLARELYTTRQVIRYWESGRQPLKLDDAVRIADRFEVSLDWLAGRAGVWRNKEDRNDCGALEEKQ